MPPQLTDLSPHTAPILVTGGAGFIGSNFILGWLGANVAGARGPLVNLDKLTYAGNSRNLATVAGRQDYAFVHGDIGDADLVRRTFEEHQPRALLHFAAESHVDRSIAGPDAFLRTNIEGTFTLLQATRAYLDTIDASARERFRFLHVSTDEVYGSLGPEDAAFHEDTPYAPNSPYAASKAASDHLVRAWTHTYQLPALITNCSNNYGPFQFPEKLLPLMITNALDGKPLPVYGDGQQIRDWLFVADHCRALEAVLARGRVGETYNIGGGNQRSNLEVVRMVCDLLDELVPASPHRPHGQLIQFVTDRPGHDRRYAIDAAKIERELGWQAAESFDSGLRQTVEWYLAHRAWTADVTSGAYRHWIEQNYGGRVLVAAEAQR